MSEYPDVSHHARKMIWNWIETVIKPSDWFVVSDESEWQDLVEMMVPAVTESLNRAYQAGKAGLENPTDGTRLVALFFDLLRSKFALRQ